MKNIFLLMNLTILTIKIFGQSQPILVMDLNPGKWSSLNINSGADSRLHAFNGNLFLVADNGNNGEELHIYNPSNNSLKLVKDIRAGSGYSQIFQMQSSMNKLFFACDDIVHGLELWSSDGTSTNTLLMKDINPQGNGVFLHASRYAISPSGLFFTGKGSLEGEELWFSDGTPAGTKIVKDLRIGSVGSFPYSLFYHPGLKSLFFAADNGSGGTELFISDGTATGTKLLKDIISGSSSSPFAFSAFNDKVIFSVKTAFDFNSGKTKYETYISDGTLEGTNSIYSKFIAPSAPNISNYTTMGNRCIFSSDNSLYVTDGTPVGTKFLTNKLKIKDDHEFKSLHDKVIFLASDSIFGEELYITDGTISGTKLLKDVNPGPANSFIYDMTISENKLYFIATTTLEDKQIWESDGTTAGTKLSFRVNQKGSSFVSNLTTLNKSLYFIADDGTTGAELWRYSAGITAGQYISSDFEMSIFPNPNSGSMTIKCPEVIRGIEILDLYGKIQFSSEENKKTIPLNLNLLPGFYYIRLKSESLKLFTSKFLVIK